ncbi:hypothetical protein [Alkalitalea saponilacus]|uniref:Uncharacterized protein n=1 Tax=Alkalitalea saponilacus TaxID=889453 RepID=A0A1T5HSE6_9BACT|nr:hypothetical protein [Alkalitalea saponilacus]ASB47691.1 hypothetical protein CDL62_00240 [Alkalitalea saponilacus]SKC23616.1 hypothetical protein SAMN03080601_02895 [Alkalitalea saponilacus]
MKKIIFNIVITALLLAGCGDKEIYLYPSFTESGTAFVHHEGAFAESADIDVREIQDAIKDLDTDGEITDVMVEGIFLDVALNATPEQPANTAEEVVSSIFITGWDNTEYILVENLTISLNATTQSVNLNQYLKKPGVDQLRNILKAIAYNTVPHGKNQISIRIEGNTFPNSTFINAKMDVRIKVVVEYKDEVKGL